MLVLQRVVTPPHPCAYLPDRPATLDYSYVGALSPQEYEDLMNQGYRKFGRMLFRPVCDACSECRPIRIPVDRFRPDRSQRRAWKRNEDLQVRLGPPRVDRQRLELYARYHQAQEQRRGWPEQEKDAGEYAFSFTQNPLPAVEISLWEGEALRAVVLTDLTPNVVSGVYHYYDPAGYERSLGTYCMLRTIELARSERKRWAYFGFYVRGCGSLAYKARFRPCEIMDTGGVWREFEPGPRACGVAE
jgi:leucyl-tRNA---protein transferase